MADVVGGEVALLVASRVGEVGVGWFPKSRSSPISTVSARPTSSILTAWSGCWLDDVGGWARRFGEIDSCSTTSARSMKEDMSMLARRFVWAALDWRGEPVCGDVTAEGRKVMRGRCSGFEIERGRWRGFVRG